MHCVFIATLICTISIQSPVVLPLITQQYMVKFWEYRPIDSHTNHEGMWGKEQTFLCFCFFVNQCHQIHPGGTLVSRSVTDIRRLHCVSIPGHATTHTTMMGMNLQLLFCSLVVLSAALQATEAQPCPNGCRDCETDHVDCSYAGLTSFPLLSLTVQQSVREL